MIKNNKKQLIITSIVTLLPMFIGLLLWNIFPNSMTIHWGIEGKANGWSSKIFTICVMPLIMLVLQWFFVFIISIYPKNKGQNHRIIGVSLWLIPIISLVISGTIYAISLNSKFDISIVLRVFTGLIFIIVGNYLPKCKQNHIIGIRVKWTFESEENWYKTHRFAGKIWVIGGIILLIVMMIPMSFEYFMYLFIAAVMVLSFTPVIYSYSYYKKQLQQGTAIKETTIKNEDTTWQKKLTIGISIFTGIICIIVGILLFTGNIKIHYKDTSFTIEASYWEDLTVKYDDIDKIEYAKKYDAGERTFGVGSFKLQLGNFKNKNDGKYTRYTYVGCDSCVILSKDDKILVINGKDEKDTKKIYNKLKKEMEK